MTARCLFQLLSPPGERARLSVMIFHRVREQKDPLFPGEPDVEHFAKQMHWVARWFNVLPLFDAVRRLRSGALPARAAAITFDDGYADNYSIALPVLKHFGLSATFFISTGFLDGGRMWNDTVIESVRRTTVPALDLPHLNLGNLAVDTLAAKRAAISLLLSRLKYAPTIERDAHVAKIAKASHAVLPGDLMLTSAHVRALSAAGMGIGAHTVSHPILALVDEGRARAEIGDSKARLEALTGEHVALFAYPNGKPGTDYSTRDVSLVRECGFVAAFSTSRGAAVASSDPFQLPRFTPWDRSAARWIYRMAGNLRSGHRVIAAA